MQLERHWYPGNVRLVTEVNERDNPLGWDQVEVLVDDEPWRTFGVVAHGGVKRLRDKVTSVFEVTFRLPTERLTVYPAVAYPGAAGDEAMDDIEVERWGDHTPVIDLWFLGGPWQGSPTGCRINGRMRAIHGLRMEWSVRDEPVLEIDLHVESFG